jgi:hypothetical protein
MLIGRYVMRLVRPLLWIAGGMAVVAISFFGTLFILNNAAAERAILCVLNTLNRLEQRRNNTAWRTGLIPLLFRPSHYRSPGGRWLVAASSRRSLSIRCGRTHKSNIDTYPQEGLGLLLHLELANGKLAAQSARLTGIGTDGTRWWGGFLGGAP